MLQQGYFDSKPVVGEKLSTDDVKSIMLDGLKELVALFEELDITYYLAYGTLIGAVRHKGYIPWDDDIDLLLPRQDYKRFIENWRDSNSADWELLSYETCKGYGFPFAKYCHKHSVVYPSRFCSGLLYGCSIDVFPLDSFFGEDEVMAQQAFDFHRERYDTAISIYKHRGVLRPGALNAAKRFVKRLHFDFVSEQYGPWEEKLAEIDSHLIAESREENSFVGYLYCSPSNKRVWPEVAFDDGGGPNYLSFEGLRCRVPADCDKVLTIAYGDYMTLPPVEQRVSNHAYEGIYRI